MIESTFLLSSCAAEIISTLIILTSIEPYNPEPDYFLFFLGGSGEGVPFQSFQKISAKHQETCRKQKSAQAKSPAENYSIECFAVSSNLAIELYLLQDSNYVKHHSLLVKFHKKYKNLTIRT